MQENDIGREINMNNIKKLMTLLLIALLFLVCAACSNRTEGTNNSEAESSGVVMDEKDKVAIESEGTKITDVLAFTSESMVGEVLADLAFENFGGCYHAILRI